jgi:hypothetical protein
MYYTRTRTAAGYSCAIRMYYTRTGTATTVVWADNAVRCKVIDLCQRRTFPGCLYVHVHRHWTYDCYLCTFT